MSSMPRIFATIEARMTSSRLPGKVLMEAAGKPFLEHMVERLNRVSCLDGIVIATTNNSTDDKVAELAANLGVCCHRGSESDVLQRVLDAAIANRVDVIVETTGDCPLIDPSLVDDCIQEFLGSKVDYVSNILERTYPIGMDTQVFSTGLLADVAGRTVDPVDREHVSLFIYRHPEIYSLKNVSAIPELTRPQLRLTLDTPKDFELLRKIFETLYPKEPHFSLRDIIRFIDSDPALEKINADVQHNYV